MQNTTSFPFYNSYFFMHDDNNVRPEAKEDSFEKLQARISELERELKRQKEEAGKGTKLSKIVWGDQFESDSLH